MGDIHYLHKDKIRIQTQNLNALLNFALILGLVRQWPVWAHLRLGAVEEGLFPFFGLFCEEAGAADNAEMELV
jgi:hypothetical protein